MKIYEAPPRYRPGKTLIFGERKFISADPNREHLMEDIRRFNKLQERSRVVYYGGLSTWTKYL